ncbi:MAG: phosphoketolase, partial [Chromatocurvus sp.]
NPTVLARIPQDELESLLRGYGYEPHFVTGNDPATLHLEMADTLDRVLDTIADIQRRAREDNETARPRWPMIVLRTPKGWTGPTEVDGKPVENSWRAHQVPVSDVRANPDHRRLLEEW